ncbi:unnamed protein product, partial [Adineta ricciae]
PYNQPNLDSNATWSECGVTFIDNTTFRSFERGFFIDSNDTLYLVDYVSSRILIWHDHTTNPSRELSATLFEYTGLFVTLNGDIYFQNGTQTGRIDKFSSNSNTSQFVTMFSGNCYGLFVDIRNTLYCSLYKEHRVVAVSLSDNNRSAVTIAGTGSAGSQLHELQYPWGIYVDINFNLYVTDEVNDRIQLFRRGERNGTIVAGKNIPNGLTLNKPTDVVLDGNGFLYIADNKNNRIIRVGDGNFECIAGCTKTPGSASNQLNFAYALRLDSVGNLYVADEANYRIQEFSVSSSSCQTSPFVTTAVTSTHPNNSTSLFWNPHSCGINTTDIGSYCNISGNICHVQNPCLNTDNCTSLNNNQDYYCSCPLGFSGKRCQNDERPCKPSTCLNNGICNTTSTSIFNCTCSSGYEGARCETKINYCWTVTCKNRGVCRPLLGGYKCECLSGTEGEHCEQVTTKLLIYRIMSKSFAFIAIVAMGSVALFVIVMDVLKYFFGIDVTRREREEIRRERGEKRRKPLIGRFVYVNAIPARTKETL